MTPEQRRMVRRLEWQLARAMAKAARHKKVAEREEEHTLNHWQWANHWTREAVRLAKELELAKQPGSNIDVLRAARRGDVR